MKHERSTRNASPMRVSAASERSILRVAITAMVFVGLAATLAPAARATAPGKNGRIAFVRYFNEERTLGAIFTIRPDGTGLIQVTHGGRRLVATEPDWSPDGRWIVFDRTVPGEPPGLFKIRANGTHLTRLSPPYVPGEWVADLEGVWSPDGRWIAFTRHDDVTGIEGTFRMRPDGSHVRLVTMRGWEAGWAPDGDRLSYVRSHDDGRRAIFSARLDGSRERRVSPWRLHAGDHPDWSPDGRWIVFHSYENWEQQSNLYLAHPNGNGLHRITDTFTHGALRYLSYSFSPNGRKITVAFTGEGSLGNPDVWVMNPDGSGFRNITESGIWDSRPDWGPRR